MGIHQVRAFSMMSFPVSDLHTWKAGQQLPTFGEVIAQSEEGSLFRNLLYVTARKKHMSVQEVHWTLNQPLIDPVAA